MREFWRLINVFICLAGFLVSGGLLFINGESLLWIALKSVGVGLGLCVINSLMGTLLVAVAGSAADSVPGNGETATNR